MATADITIEITASLNYVPKLYVPAGDRKSAFDRYMDAVNATPEDMAEAIEQVRKIGESTE